jgi:ABC-type multidrug transport system ATPase subunit
VGYDGVPVASGISFSLDPGQSLLVIGHNGSGKSTLLKTLFGLVPPIAGTFSVLGIDGSQVTPARLVQAGARFLGQGNRSFDSLTAAQSRRVLHDLYGLAAAGEHAPLPRARIGALSLGARRIEALRLLEAGAPRCFMLDEPSSGLDVGHLESLHRWLRERRGKGMSFVVVEQQFRGLFDIVDLVMIMRQGMVSFFGPAESVRDEAVLEAAFL